MTHSALLRALLALGAFIALGSIAPASPQAAQEAPAERQILVMLQLPPPHYRPNSGYSGGYGDAASAVARRRIALRIARENGLQLVDSWPMPLLSVDCYVMQMPAGASVETVIRRVSRNRNVAWSQPMQLYEGLGGAPPAGDPLHPAAPAASKWRLADLHRIATGRAVSVAVIDSKVEVRHPDLAGQFAVDRDFVTNRPVASEFHGTGIAGVIGAKANNGLGIVGIAPSARMMALRACWQNGRSANSRTLCDSLSLARALQFAIERDAKVINLSLSGPSDILLRKLIAIALARRITVVAAFDPHLPRGGFPASQPGVIAVVEESLQYARPRLYGAPGRNVPTTQPGGKWYLVNGSSYAAAHVSGLMALVREHQSSAAPHLPIARRNGSINACATLLQATPNCDCSCPLDRPGQDGQR